MVIELLTLYPVASIIVISALVTLFSTAVTNWLTDQDHLRSLKARQKELNKKMKTAKPGEKLFEEIQTEMLQITGVMMKAQFKPMFITLIPLLVLFAWLRNVYTPVMGTNWIWYYLGGSVIFSTVYRKIFKMA